MKRAISEERLREDQVVNEGPRGPGEETTALGFHPAFYDFATQRIYASRYADGRTASCHVLDGLPDEIVVDRTASGRVTSLKATVIAGFVRNGFFFTRSAAARAAGEWRPGTTAP